jgi:hypothetical protein
MKTLLRSTLYTALLAIGLLGGFSLSLPGCKPTDMVGPPSPNNQSNTSGMIPVVDSDSAFTVPENMTALTYPDVPIATGNHRIKRIITRSFSTNSYAQKRLPMRVWVRESDATYTAYTVILKNIITYQYDAKGRLTAEYEEYINGNSSTYDTTTYRYDPAGRYIIAMNGYQTTYGIKPEFYKKKDTLWLNEQGLARNRLSGYLRLGIERIEYDTQGFMVQGQSLTVDRKWVASRWSQSIINNNIQWTSYWLLGAESGGTQISRYPSYIDQTNVPNPTPFYGRGSTNLPTEEYIAAKDMFLYPDGDKYYIRYVYRFDRQGRVKRVLSFGRKLVINWLEYYLGNIAIVDYEYE